MGVSLTEGRGWEDDALEALLIKRWLTVHCLTHCSAAGSCSIPPIPESGSGTALKE